MLVILREGNMAHAIAILLVLQLCIGGFFALAEGPPDGRPPIDRMPPMKGPMDHKAMGHAAISTHDAKPAHGSVSGGHGMMKMYFHGGYEEVVLFDFWRIDTVLGLVLSCFGVFLMAVFYEGVKWFRLYLEQRRHFRLHRQADQDHQSVPTNGDHLITSGNSNEDVAVRPPQNSIPTTTMSSRFGLWPLLEATLYMVQMVFAYVAMLVVMTYNVWLSAAVIIGCGVGHLLFSRSLPHEVNRADAYLGDCCH